MFLFDLTLIPSQSDFTTSGVVKSYAYICTVIHIITPVATNPLSLVIFTCTATSTTASISGYSPSLHLSCNAALSAPYLEPTLYPVLWAFHTIPLANITVCAFTALTFSPQVISVTTCSSRLDFTSFLLFSSPFSSLIFIQ